MAEALRAGALSLLVGASACALPGAPEGETLSQSLESFAMTQTVRGRPSWRLTAPSARVSPEGRTFLESPELEFFQDRRQGRPRGTEPDSTGKARQARVEPAGDVELIGEVVLVSRLESTTLRTDRMRYDGRRKRFHTEEAVVVERPGTVVRGRGMDADSTLSDINIYQQETEVR